MVSLRAWKWGVSLSFGIPMYGPKRWGHVVLIPTFRVHECKTYNAKYRTRQQHVHVGPLELDLFHGHQEDWA